MGLHSGLSQQGVQLSYLRMKHLEIMTGFSRITIWGWIKEGKFPDGTLVGGRVKVWPRDEVEAFMRGEWSKDKAAA